MQEYVGIFEIPKAFLYYETFCDSQFFLHQQPDEFCQGQK
jgi:hypothetical protein